MTVSQSELDLATMSAQSQLDLPVRSQLSLALFADSGWYEVSEAQAEPMAYAAQRGLEPLQQPRLLLADAPLRAHVRPAAQPSP